VPERARFERQHRVGKQFALDRRTSLEVVRVSRLERLEHAMSRLRTSTPLHAAPRFRDRRPACIHGGRSEVDGAGPPPGPGPSELARSFDRVCREIAGSDPIDQSGGQCAGCRERTPFDTYVHGRRRRHETRKALGAASSGDQPERHFGLSEPCVGRCDPEVTGHREFQSASEGKAANRGDDRFPRILDCLQQFMHPRGPLESSGSGRDRVEFPDVRAGGEVLAASHHDDSGDAGIRVGPLDTRENRLADAAGQRIDRRVVDRQERDVILPLERHEIGHDGDDTCGERMIMGGIAAQQSRSLLLTSRRSRNPEDLM
jgi:hypothetical protein